jgi:4-hydroxyphenylpyruvate dioxygenase
LHVLFDRDAHGGTLSHCCTPAVGRMLFEIVERRGGYDGYGAADATVRMVAQRQAASSRMHASSSGHSS